MTDIHQFLSRIGLGLERGKINQREAAFYLSQRACRELRCSRASMWAMSDESDMRTLRLAGGFDALEDRAIFEPHQWQAASVAQLVDRLCSDGVYVSCSAESDERLSFLTGGYGLQPAAASSLLAGIGINGQTCCVLWCDEVNTKRTWTAADIRKVKQIANAVSLHRARNLGRRAPGGDRAQALGEASD